MLLKVIVAVGVLAVMAAPSHAKPKPKKPPPPPTPVEPAKSPEKTRADKLFDDGRKYLQNQEYALACTAFEQSQEADPAIGTQLNIALCYEDWGHFASAYRAYAEAERIATEKSDDRVKHARKKMEELKPKIPRLKVEVSAGADPSVVFLLDAKEIDMAALSEELMLDIGEHVVEARVPGAPPKVEKVTLENGQRKTVKLQLPKAVAAGGALPPRNAGKFYGGLGMVIGGGAALGIASFVSLLARNDYNDAILMCPMSVCATRDAYNTTQNARKTGTYMTIVGGAGVALVGVGVYLMLSSRPSPPDKLAAAPLLSPGVVGLAIGGPL